MKYAVIGGGITGLSVAHKLAQNGQNVTLFERSARIGGLVASFKIADTWLEKYFHHIFLSDTAIRKMIAEVGLENDLIWKETPMGFYGNQKIHSFDGALDLLSLSVLSFPDRIRFGFKLLQAQKMKNGIELDHLTAKEWIEKDWSPAIYQKFWGPLLRSKFSDSADQISAAWLWGRIFARANSRSGGKEKLGYLRGGFIQLMEVMADIAKKNETQFRLHQEIKQVLKSGSKWVVATETNKEEFDAVIFTIPSPYISSICPDLPSEERKMHEKIQYVAISCMPIVMNKPLSKMYWINIGDPTIPFTGVIEHTNYISKDEYAGMHLVYLFNYLPQNHPWLKEPKDVLFSRYEEGLKRMFPNYRRDQVEQVMLFRDPYANVIYTKNYRSQMPPIVSKASGIYYANTSQIFPQDRNQNFSIELAEQVVNEIKKRNEPHK